MAASARLLALRRILDDGRFHSGQELARRLGVTRTAVWKLLERMRQLGYAVDARPRGGYRLAGIPDWPLPWEVALRLGEEESGARPIYFYPSLPSTNDAARQLAEAGAPAGTLVVADRQTAGRGRRGRTWLSPPGGIYLSVVARPRCQPSQAPVLALASALAVARAVEALSGQPAAVKWPNDVLVHERKLSGVLAEVAADQETLRWAVIGIGLNVEPVPAGEHAFPRPIGLVELGCGAHRAAVIARVVQELEGLLQRLDRSPAEAPAEVAREIEARLVWKGRPVRVDTPAAPVEGELVGVDASGALLLRVASGETLRLFAGDVTLRARPA